MKNGRTPPKHVAGVVLSDNRGWQSQKLDYDLDTAKISHTAPTNAFASAGVPIVMRK